MIMVKKKSLNKRELLKIIKEEFPRLNYSKAKLNNKGWDHTILILDDKFVFRFPKDECYIKKIKIEMELLNTFNKDSPLRVPKYHFMGKDSVFGGYKLIEGKELTKTVFGKLSNFQKKNCAKQLGEFLTILHNFPVSIAKKIGLKDDWPLSDEKKEYENRKSFIFSVLSNNEGNFVKSFSKKYFSMKIPSSLTVIHNDLSGAHILINNGKITGVIDFGDSSLGDPAKDFAWLWELGDRFALDVLRSYDRQIDKEFLVRSHYYNFAGTLSQLYHGVADKKKKLLRDSLKKIKSTTINSDFLSR